MINRITKKNFTTSFHEWGSIDSWLVEPIRGDGLLFPLSYQRFLVLIPGTLVFTSQRWKAESTWELLSS